MPRSGVTVILPHEGDPGAEPVFAGTHTLNGNGEMTGLEWIREAGTLTSAIGLTNTHSVGIVHHALVGASVNSAPGPDHPRWSLPVVAETWDGYLNDIDGQHVTEDDVLAALASAQDGPGGGGQRGRRDRHEGVGFKAGIGTASRVVAAEDGGFTVGALVQANHGRRERLIIDGVPVGREISRSEIPGPDRAAADGGSSIIVILATDAPLLPHQCRRLAQRATLGVARTGGGGEHDSGDIFLAFATGNRNLRAEDHADAIARDVRMLDDDHITALFWAADRGHRGGDRQRPAGRRDDDRQRHDLPCPARRTACWRSCADTAAGRQPRAPSRSGWSRSRPARGPGCLPRQRPHPGP